MFCVLSSMDSGDLVENKDTVVPEETKLTEFTEVILTKKAKKCPKRLVYFSDGVLEEYSTDEDVVDVETQPLVDTKSLPWIPYLSYMMWWFGSRTLAVCDYFGENLAWLLGITSPKFQYEIEQYNKLVKEEEELQKYLKEENAGWKKDDTEANAHPQIVEMQPGGINSIKLEESSRETMI